MKKKKGIVLEIEGQRAIVLGPGGEFRNIRLRQPVQVGDEIELAEERVALLSSWRSWLSAVAAVFLVLALLPVWQGWNQPALGPVVTYLSLDINPSFQLGLDEQNRVVEEQGLNQEARDLLNSAQVHGLEAAEAVNRLTRAAAAAGYLDKNSTPQIILAVASKQGSEKAAQVAALLRQQTKEFLKRQQLQVALKTVVTVPEAVQIAAGQGLSLGRLAQNIEVKKQQQAEAQIAVADRPATEKTVQQPASPATSQVKPKNIKPRQQVTPAKPAAPSQNKPVVSAPNTPASTKPAATQPEDQGIVYITEIDLTLGGEGGNDKTTGEPAKNEQAVTEQSRTQTNPQ